MGQSLVKNYIHLVFSTKYRQPLIDSEIEERLFGYMGGICNQLDCQTIKVGGYRDHVHILCMLSKKLTLMTLLAKVKANSSKWIKTQGKQYHQFFWQNGYGAFSVNPAEIETVVSYIANQKVHHQKKSFKEEYLAFLKKYDVEFDERYVWD